MVKIFFVNMFQPSINLGFQCSNVASLLLGLLCPNGDDLETPQVAKWLVAHYVPKLSFTINIIQYHAIAFHIIIYHYINIIVSLYKYHYINIIISKYHYINIII